jgi:thioredoxin-related protein
MRTVVFFHKPTCPYCIQFNSKIWNDLVKENFGNEEVIFKKVDVTKEKNIDILNAIRNNKKFRDEIFLKTVPHLLMLTESGDYIWTGGGEPNRTLDNVIKFVKGREAHATRL